MNKRGYQAMMIAGLRSNPKLCHVAGEYAVCGMACTHASWIDVKKHGTYDKAVVQAKKVAIELHDQWMKTAKRNRIREGYPWAMLNVPLTVRRPAGGFRWVARQSISQANITTSAGAVLSP